MMENWGEDLIKNYFEHEKQVKYIDGLLERSQDWQWLIDYIEENFILDDVCNWVEFQERDKNLRQVLLHFIKIIEVCRTMPKINNKVCMDLYIIAQYYNGIIEQEECKECITTQFGYTLYFVIWITKLENQDNKTKYVVDYRLLQQKNLWDLINIESLELYKEDICGIASNIKLSGFEKAMNILCNNIEKKNYECKSKFIDNIKERILSGDIFNFHFIKRENFITWQEEYVMDMLEISIRDSNLVPKFSNGITTTPDFTLWTKDVLNKIKSYFNCKEIDFVVETISLIKFNSIPSNNTIILHCKLLSDVISNSNQSFEIINSSFFQVISFLFKNKLMVELNKEKEYVEFLKSIHCIVEPILLDNIKNAGIPLSKEQKNIIKSFYEEKYKNICEINHISEFLKYLQDKDIPKKIDNEYYLVVVKRFQLYIQCYDEIDVPNLFYNFMVFLINVNATNQNVDKKLVKEDMIYTQKLWQQEYYEKQCGKLQTISSTTKVSKKELQLYNEQILENPIYFAKRCISSNKDFLCGIMEQVSEHAIVYLCSRTLLTASYPIKNNGVKYEKREIDTLLRNIVDDINNNSGYKFLNAIETDTYLLEIHEKYKENAKIFVSLFTKEEELYNIISKEMKYELITYKNNVKLAHLTQLFPILEIKIRELASLVGIVPFKENLENFMEYKDPSSVLRELLQEIYVELKALENVPDLLFIYYFMYNSNSLNIRNECIHGRDYLSGSRLKFAFRITLLSIYMVIFRIKIIQQNLIDKDI